jgi:hypothetical protein
VPQSATFARYFVATMAETFSNRIYQRAAQTDRLTNTFDISTLPTIWDGLAAAGLSGRYYYSDVPFLALWGPKHLPISRSVSAFLADCPAGDEALERGGIAAGPTLPNRDADRGAGGPFRRPVRGRAGVEVRRRAVGRVRATPRARRANRWPVPPA